MRASTASRVVRRRNTPRFAVRGPAELLDLDDRVGFVADVSRDGMLVESENLRHKPGDVVAGLRILTDDGDLSVPAARVVRIAGVSGGPYHVGYRFCDPWSSEWLNLEPRLELKTGPTPRSSQRPPRFVARRRLRGSVFAGGVELGRLRDVSFGGLSFETEESLAAPGESLSDLRIGEFRIPDARVVRTASAGRHRYLVGCEFDSSSYQTWQHLLPAIKAKNRTDANRPLRVLTQWVPAFLGLALTLPIQIALAVLFGSMSLALGILDVFRRVDGADNQIGADGSVHPRPVLESWPDLRRALIGEVPLLNPTGGGSAKSNGSKRPPLFTALRSLTADSIGYGWRAALVWVWWLCLRWLFPTPVVLLGYPGQRSQFQLYWDPNLRTFAPPIVPMGLMTRNGLLGAYGFGLSVPQELLRSSVHIQELLSATRRAFPYARSIAPTGSLPSIAIRQGVEIRSPFVDGIVGTVFAVDHSLRALVELTGRPAKSTRVAVLGGGGLIATNVIPEIAPRYDQVVAVDPTFQGTEQRKGNVLYTARHSAIEMADVVLVLTSAGSAALRYVPYVREGQVWGDDTHPEMDALVCDSIAARGAQVFKVSVTDGQLSFWPRIKTMDSMSTPGCLLMAVVKRLAGDEACTDFSSFASAAIALGFTAILTKHTNETPIDSVDDHAQLASELGDLFRRLDHKGGGLVPMDRLRAAIEEHAAPDFVDRLLSVAQWKDVSHLSYPRLLSGWIRLDACTPST